MHRKGIAVLVAAFALVIFGVSFMTAQDKTKGPDREADKAAIDSLIKANVEAFNKRDAAAVAANWTAEGEYVRNNGETVRGKTDIQRVRGLLQVVEGKADSRGPTGQPSLPVRGFGRFGSHPAAEK